MHVSFSIDGKWFTDFVRNRFFYEDVDYDWAVATMREILKPNGLTESRIEQITQDIILGRSYFKGNTLDGSFVYCDCSDEPIKGDFFRKYSKMRAKLKEEEKVRVDAVNAWNELALVIKGEISRRDCECQCNIDFLRPTPTEEFIDRMIAPEEEVAPYGFVEPNGEFHNVKWAAHEEFAISYVEKNGWLEDLYNSSNSIYHTDYLVHIRGWLLLHNPSQGKPILTTGDKPMTKAQREFLFDYYTKYGMEVEANELYKEG